MPTITRTGQVRVFGQVIGHVEKHDPTARNSQWVAYGPHHQQWGQYRTRAEAVAAIGQKFKQYKTEKAEQEAERRAYEAQTRQEAEAREAAAETETEQAPAEFKQTMSEIYGYQGATTADLMAVMEDAEALSAEAAQGPTKFGVMASVEDILDRAVAVADLTARALGDYPDRIDPKLIPVIRNQATRLFKVAEALRTAPVGLSTLESAHQAAATIIRQSARTVERATY